MVVTAPTRTSSKRQGNGNGNTSPQTVESYHPAPDAQTYRDLLIFEERLKQNAARLVKRKKKYQTFLVLLCLAISVFSYNVFLNPQEWQPLHYLNVTILLVTATMLFLFFASGMYAERITAANKFVPQANRSLRNFNMYLNTRKVPHRSLFSLITPSRSPSPKVVIHTAATPMRTSENPSVGEVRQAMTQQPSSVARRMHIPAIPPTSNPRGELIFSSKVTGSFREGYERYRAAFERRRKEKLEERRWMGWRRWWGLGSGKAQSQDPSGSAEKGGALRQAGHVVAPIRGSPRISKNRTRSGTSTSLNSLAGSEASSRASSRASSPTGSPVVDKRTIMRRTRKESETLEEENETSSSRRGRNRTPSVTTMTAELVVVGELPKDLLGISIPENEHPVIAPDPVSVADLADDRSTSEATLREPDGG